MIFHLENRTKPDLLFSALTDEGELAKTKWYTTIGKDFVAKAFEYAHEADSNVELYYNNYSLDELTKCDAAVHLAKDLQSKGLCIDVVGIQGQWGKTLMHLSIRLERLV